jgi:hypothetical protein
VTRFCINRKKNIKGEIKVAREKVLAIRMDIGYNRGG